MDPKVADSLANYMPGLEDEDTGRFSISFCLPGAFPLWAKVVGTDGTYQYINRDFIASCELYTDAKCNVDSLIHDDYHLLRPEAREIIRSRTIDALADRITQRVKA